MTSKPSSDYEKIVQEKLKNGISETTIISDLTFKDIEI